MNCPSRPSPLASRLSPPAFCLLPATDKCPSITREVDVRDHDQQDHEGRVDNIGAAPAPARLLAVLVGDGGVGQPRQAAFLRRLGRVADRDHHDDAHQEDERAVVLEVDVVDDPQERARRVTLLVPRHLQRDGRVHRQPERAEQESDQKRREAALGVQPLVEHPEEEHREDGRREVALHALQIVVQALRALDDGDPEQPDEHHHRGRDASDPDQLGLASPSASTSGTGPS